MTDAPQPPRRRDLLTTTAFVLTAAGGAAALWPLLSATTPDAETRARRRIFALGSLGATGEAVADIDGKPILVFRRSKDELDRIATGASTTGPDWKQSPYRSRRPDIMVCIARCTHDDVIVTRTSPPEGTGLRCLLCNSRYDLAGRRTSGIATRDLVVPDYRFISAGEIEFAPL